MYSDLEEIIHQLKSCTSLLDNIPNKLFKSVSRCFTNHIINSSLQTGIFPVSLRCAVITLLLSKNNLESLVMIMEAFLIFHSSKYFKKNVYKQPDECLSNHSIYDEYQSGFRSNHSTEAAPAKVINDLQINSDSQRVAVLLLLDLTAAFDTADRDILI